MIKTNLVRLFFLLFIGISSIAYVSAQKGTKIDLVNANTLEYNGLYNKNVKRLIGNVILQHNGTMLYCDSAYLYTEGNNVDAYGNVKINSGSVNITGDALQYEGNTKIAQLHKNVTLNDGSMTLTTDHLTFNLSSNIGSYTTGGKIVSPENTLTSVIGYYYSNDKNFFFRKKVVLVNPQYTMNCDTLKYNTETDVSYFIGPTTIVSKENKIYCENGWYDSKKDIAQFNKNAIYSNKDQTIEGDSLYYDRVKGIGKAFQNITITDSLQDIKILGNYAFYNEKLGSTLITDKAVLIQQIERDTLFLHADTLFAIFDSTRVGKIMYAYHKAKFFKTDLQGLADSLVYNFKDSLITMFYNPVLWTEKNQLTADTISIVMKNKKIDKMNLYSSSFVISQDDSIRFNQVKGKNLTGFFADNELKQIHVYGNGETVYYVRDGDSLIIGVNIARSDSLKIFVDKNEIQTISFISKPEATLYPESELSRKDTILKNFRWEDAKRPARREDIFIWKEEELTQKK